MLVRLHVPRAAYHRHIEPELGRLARLLPEVVLDLSVDDAFSDFEIDGFDLSVVHAEGVDSGMTEIRIGGCLRHAVVASPEYLLANGSPQEPAHLLDHRGINWRRQGEKQEYRWRFGSDSELVTMAVCGPLTVSHCDVAIAAAIAGVGVAYVCTLSRNTH